MSAAGRTDDFAMDCLGSLDLDDPQSLQTAQDIQHGHSSELAMDVQQDLDCLVGILDDSCLWDAHTPECCALPAGSPGLATVFDNDAPALMQVNFPTSVQLI